MPEDLKVPLDRIVMIDSNKHRGKKLLVRQLDPDTKTAGGIILAAAEDHLAAEVLKLCPELAADASLPLAVGDVVCVGSHCLRSTDLKKEIGERVFAVDWAEILAGLKQEASNG